MLENQKHNSMLEKINSTEMIRNKRKSRFRTKALSRAAANAPVLGAGSSHHMNHIKNVLHSVMQQNPMQQNMPQYGGNIPPVNASGVFNNGMAHNQVMNQYPYQHQMMRPMMQMPMMPPMAGPKPSEYLG